MPIWIKVYIEFNYHRAKWNIAYTHLLISWVCIFLQKQTFCFYQSYLCVIHLNKVWSLSPYMGMFIKYWFISYHKYFWYVDMAVVAQYLYCIFLLHGWPCLCLGLWYLYKNGKASSHFTLLVIIRLILLYTK